MFALANCQRVGTLAHHDLSRTRRAPGSHHHADIDACVDAGMHAVTHDHAELPPARVD